MRSVVALAPARMHVPLTLRWRPWSLHALVIFSVVAGCAFVVATMEIGGGDYGQWLMTARPYIGLDLPAYRADAAVPPVVPAVLGLLQRLSGEPITALRLLVVLLVATLGVAASLAAGSFFRSWTAALLATAGCLLITDRFLDLFAFGGLLQAASVALLWLSVATFQRAGDGDGGGWRWWTAGAGLVGLGALSHVGTGSMLIPAAAAVALIATLRVAGGWRDCLARLVPLGVVLVVVASYWLAVILPSSVDLARNPASLDYRGPSRLLDSLTAYQPTILLIVLGSAGLILGAVAEVRRRRIGPWLALFAWTATSLAMLAGAVVSGVATDYPRFATPILAPLVIAAAGVAAIALEIAARRLAARRERLSGFGWSLALATLLVMVATPAAVGTFRADSMGYRVAELDRVREAGVWIDEHVPAGKTVLGPAREAKWIEGLTGREALFSNAIRYSFRPEEWQRSLAADALLRSSGGLVNEFFFARFADADSGADAPRQLSIAANHGGEFVDLLATAPGATLVLDEANSTLASLANLPGSSRRQIAANDEVGLALGWTGDRNGQPVSYRQTVLLHRYASTMELRAGVSTPLAFQHFQIELRPTELPLTDVRIDGRWADLVFASLGSKEPKLRVLIARGDASLTALPDGGGLHIDVVDEQVRILITDLTAAPSPSMGLQVLEPAQLVDRYDVGAVLLRRDPTFEARRARLETLGFGVAELFGSYVVLVRE